MGTWLAWMLLLKLRLYQNDASWSSRDAVAVPKAVKFRLAGMRGRL